MKALYIMGSQDMKVILNGPALCVRQPGRADGRYPLARVSRIVTRADVVWDPHALNVCLHAGKPIAVLDRQGRFVRIRFSVPSLAVGLARHVGELLDIERYRRRYLRWLHMEDRYQMAAVACRLGIVLHRFRREQLWQSILSAQTRRHTRRLGRSYRYLEGLATAHVASLLVSMGLPSSSDMWGKQEFRFLMDLVRLETWHHIGMVDRAIDSRGDIDHRWLAQAFERRAQEREARIAIWRQQALLAMMGIPVSVQKAHSFQRVTMPSGTAISREGVRLIAGAYGRVAGSTATVRAPRVTSARTDIKRIRPELYRDGRWYGTVRAT